MHKYMVHIEREGLMDWRVRLTGLGNQIAFNTSNIKVESNIDNVRLSGMETWYCDDPTVAEELAKKIAVECPGRKVNVYTLNSVTVSTASPAVTSEFNEKGLVPK